MALWGFWAKKLISCLALPLGQVLLLGLLGALLWWRRPTRRLGPWLMILAGLWLLVLSLPVTGLGLMRPLEARNWSYATPAGLSAQRVRAIVVLNGGTSLGDNTPADRLGSATLKRLLEGVRLWRRLPGAKLVLSGGGVDRPAEQEQVMIALAREVGVPRKSIVWESLSWDTEDQARVLRARLRGKPFALVTSAMHMPRSLAWFRAYGLDPVAAPCDFRTKDPSLSLSSFLPSADGLQNSEEAIHEYLGLGWQWLKQVLGTEPEKATS
jgi:uncharacterized SAM-binding protein YcdF (DUF218 family)